MANTLLATVVKRTIKSATTPVNNRSVDRTKGMRLRNAIVVPVLMSASYIKDLADQTEVLKRRVDSMEQGNVRGSFDVGDLFASPDDPTMSAKRNYSRTSFSAAELGSQGFANMNYTPTSSAARLRYSVAIPPDQQVLQSVNSEDYYDEGMQRAAKRLKMDDPQLQTIAIDSNDLSKYYATIHPDFPLLPDASDVAISIIQQATPELQHAFLGAIDLLPGPLNNASISKSRIGTEVAMVASLQAAYKEDMNTTTNMVTYIWTCVLLIIHTECAMDMYRVGSITSPPILVRQYMQVIKKLRSDLSKAQRAAGDTQGLDAATLEDVVMRTFCFASLQEKLVLIATHNYDLSDQEIRPEPEDIATVNGLSPAHRYLASATKLLAFSLPNLVNPKDIAARTNKNIILDLLKLEAIRVQLDYSSATFCQQLTDFFELLLVRTQRLAMPLDVLTPVAKLCEKLGTPAVTYAPLEIHFYTTCVFTILEVLALPTDFAIEYAAPVAVTALKTIRGALQEKAVAFSAARSPTEINYWGVYNGKPIIKKHWAQVLLLHLEKAEQKGWYNENSAKLASLGGTMGVRGLPKDVTGNFGQLLDYGYLTILSEYAARQEQEELVGGGGGVAEAGIGAGGLGGSGGMLQGNGEAASASTAVETAAAANAAVEEGGH